MLQSTGNSRLYDQTRDRIAKSLVGFVGIPNASEEPLTLLGSGTLAAFETHKGIVTAGHVWEGLREHDQFGVVYFANGIGQAQRILVPVDHVAPVILGTPPWSEHGPDLAYLKLPMDAVGGLEVYCTFINLAGHLARALSSGGRKGMFAIAGVVDERTKPTSHSSTKRTLMAEAVVEPGDVSALQPVASVQRCEFAPAAHPSYMPPSSYQGMSGGGLWVGLADTTAGADGDLQDIIFAGVNFWETDAETGARRVICHSEGSLRDRLVPAVVVELGR